MLQSTFNDENEINYMKSFLVYFCSWLQCCKNTMTPGLIICNNNLEIDNFSRKIGLSSCRLYNTPNLRIARQWENHNSKNISALKGTLNSRDTLFTPLLLLFSTRCWQTQCLCLIHKHTLPHCLIAKENEMLSKRARGILFRVRKMKTLWKANERTLSLVWRRAFKKCPLFKTFHLEQI